MGISCVCWKGTKNVKIIELKENNLFDLYYKLVKKGIISIDNTDPYDEMILKKNQKTWGDFSNEDGKIDYKKYQDWLKKEREIFNR